MNTTIPPAVLEVLLRDRPFPAWERIKRTCVASRVTGGWSCVWASTDGLSAAHQLVTDEDVGAILGCRECGGGPVEVLGCTECGAT